MKKNSLLLRLRHFSWWKIPFFIPILLSLFAFTKAMETAPAQNLPRTVELKIDKKIITVDLAVTNQQKMRGLMFRKNLPDNDGMLFLMGSENRVNFWMKNTYVPLSIAFIAKDGTILEIADMEPLSEKVVSSKSDSVTYTLEMNQKWFSLNGIAAGDKIIPLKTSWSELDQLEKTNSKP